jgi:hypothetical protein
MRAIPIDRFLDPDDAGGGRSLDWRTLVSEARAARRAADGGFWRIGDLAQLVERRYASGALKRFAEEIGDTVGTVRRLRWVAGTFDPAGRARFPELSFSHFQAVASLEDRLVWLERAQRGGWSVDRLVTQTRTGRARIFPAERYRRPVDAAARSVARLARMKDRELARAARAGLGDAVDELAAEVGRLRARLQRVGRVRLVAGRRATAR